MSLSSLTFTDNLLSAFVRGDAEKVEFWRTETNQTQRESERITSEKIKDPSGQSLPEKTVAWAEYACPSGLCALS